MTVLAAAEDRGCSAAGYRARVLQGLVDRTPRRCARPPGRAVRQRLLVGGSFKAVAIAWAGFFLVLAALQFSVGYWYLGIIRSAQPLASPLSRFQG